MPGPSVLLYLVSASLRKFALSFLFFVVKNRPWNSAMLQLTWSMAPVSRRSLNTSTSLPSMSTFIRTYGAASVSVPAAGGGSLLLATTSRMKSDSLVFRTVHFYKTKTHIVGHART